jgi:Zn-dependent protease with chaperone function
MRNILLTALFVFLLSLICSAQNNSNVKQQEVRRVEVPPMSEKAVRYYRSGVALWVLDTALGFLIPALFLFTGFSARIRNWAQSLGRKWFFVIAIYIVIFTILNFLIYLPISYYEDFVRQHAYGLSNQTFEKWLTDALKGLMVGVVMGVLFLWVPYLLLKKSPTRWWLYTGILAIPFFALVTLIAPIWIDTLFNKFGPMNDKALEAKILGLADKAGIQGSRVYEVNKSVDTKTVNAYVTGFGNTKRIVLWDTILAKLNQRELMTVMGHEMGHYVLGHVIKAILFFSFVTIVLLYAAYRVAGGMIQKYQNRFGFNELSDVASLPLILLLINIFGFVITPGLFAFTRHQEHEADRFGLEITKDNYAAANAFVRLQEENLSNPRPGLIMKLFRSTHPPLGERIDFCNEYRPWETGQPLKYDHLFKK